MNRNFFTPPRTGTPLRPIHPGIWARSPGPGSNVLDGSTWDEALHCKEQFERSMDVLERRATFKDGGPECEARISPDSQFCTHASALIAAGRDISSYGPGTTT